MEEQRPFRGQKALCISDFEMMEGLLELKGMRFHAFHGCLPQERVDGGKYLVDFSVRLDVEAAYRGDELGHTLDYSRVYALVREQMAIPSNLIENVAGRIAVSIRTAFPELPPFTVKLTKLAPPLGGECEGASITLIG